MCMCVYAVAWAGPGVLAAATKEKMVRLLDLAADESYNLSTSKLAIGEMHTIPIHHDMYPP